VAKFFSDNSFRYTIAPRVSAEYVDFPWQAYVSESTPTDAEVRKYFDDHPGRFPKPAPAKAPAAAKPDPAADFAAVQPQVRAALQMERAKRLATKAASDLTYALYEGKVARGAPLDAFLAGKKLKVTPLAPFTLEAGPAELGGSHEIAAAAFELNADRFYSEGLPSPDGAVVLIWKESLPAREPLLAEVRDKVRADALDNEKRKRFVEFGQAFRASIERRLKAGESFDKAAVAAASPNKVEVKSYPAFSLRTQPHDIDPAVIPVLDHLEKGGVSDLQPTADKGLVIYAADKKLPALDAANPRYAMVKAQLAMSFARTDSLSILGEIVDKEVKRMDASLK
jgi:peptidyl-prolyl cis-trans isomerase D